MTERILKALSLYTTERAQFDNQVAEAIEELESAENISGEARLLKKSLLITEQIVIPVQEGYRHFLEQIYVFYEDEEGI